MKIVEEETPTIMSGLVVRYYLRCNNGDPLWFNQPEISASQNGVLISGAWPVAKDLALVREMLDRAEAQAVELGCEMERAALRREGEC